MPIEIERVLGRCISCSDKDERDGVLRISAGYRIGMSRNMQSIKLCNVCILALKKALQTGAILGVEPLEFGPEPYACLEDHD